MFKKLIVTLVVLAFLAAPGVVHAEDQAVICPQPYGGGVVCGVHTPVNTGIADNLPMIGSGLLSASAVFAYFSNKLKRNK